MGPVAELRAGRGGHVDSLERERMVDRGDEFVTLAA